MGRQRKRIRYNDGSLSSPRTDSDASEGLRLDLALIERIRARDASAVGELYDRHSRLLYGLILRMLRDRSEAEDVLQEVFLLVWNRVTTYDTSLGSPAGWLVGIARNRAIDRLRTAGVRRRTLEEAAAESTPTHDPERSAQLGERQRAVLRALEALPREQRELIEEAYYLGFTQSELAERHQLPLGTVKTRIRNGMMALRQQLQEVMVKS
jgi:RNA polymerase sigma-70 factor (ECF subfamily)